MARGATGWRGCASPPGPACARPARALPLPQGPRRRLSRWCRQVALITGERVAILKGAEAEKSAANLMVAGFRSRDALLIYPFLKLAVPVLKMTGSALWFVLIGRYMGHPMRALIVLLAANLAASKAIDDVLGTIRKRRLDKIRRKFPDVLELLVITSDSDLSPIAALKRVVSVLEGIDTALAEELRQLVIELPLLADPSVANSNLEDRVPLPEIQLFVTTMEQAERFGTSFSQAMRMLIRDQRAHILLRVEERAARIPATMTVPLILFIMSALFVILIGPASLAMLDNIMARWVSHGLQLRRAAVSPQ